MTTPMMQQYQEAKARHPGMLLLFRMGDFYELYGEDAETAAKVLGLTISARRANATTPLPPAGGGGRGRRCNGDGGDERHHVRLHGVRGLGGECSDRPRRRWDHRTWRMRGRRRHNAQQTVSQKREARARQASPPHRELAPFGRDPGNCTLQTGRS